MCEWQTSAMAPLHAAQPQARAMAPLQAVQPQARATVRVRPQTRVTTLARPHARSAPQPQAYSPSAPRHVPHPQASHPRRYLPRRRVPPLTHAAAQLVPHLQAVRPTPSPPTRARFQIAASWGSPRSTYSGTMAPRTSRRCLGRFQTGLARGDTSGPTPWSTRRSACGARRCHHGAIRECMRRRRHRRWTNWLAANP